MAGINIFSEVRVVLAEPRVSIRKEYLEVLQELGCRDIVETGNFKDVEEAFDEGDVDLLVGEASLPEGDLTEVVDKVRHGKLGNNPFIIAMMMVDKSDQGTIRRVIDCGADDILIKPTTKETLRERLTLFARGRKKFVVTTNYVGPDRRTSHRPGTMEIPQIKVPNPLQTRIAGRSGAGFMARAIAASVKLVNEQKVERYAYSMNWIIARINQIKTGKMEAGDVDINKEMVRLHEISIDCRSRLKDTCYQPIAEMAVTLEQMSGVLAENEDPTGQSDFVLVSKLVRVIKRRCDSLAGRLDAVGETEAEAEKPEQTSDSEADSGEADKPVGISIGAKHAQTKPAPKSLEQKLAV